MGCFAQYGKTPKKQLPRVPQYFDEWAIPNTNVDNQKLFDVSQNFQNSKATLICGGTQVKCIKADTVQKCIKVDTVQVCV